MRWWTFELGREGPVSGFRTTAVGGWVESGYDGIRAVFHGEPINARCDQSRRLPRLLRAAPQAGYRIYWDTQDSAQRLACTSSHARPFSPITAVLLFLCPVSILVSQPACESCATDLGPPSETSTLFLYRRFMHACDLCSPGRLPNHRQTSEFDPVSPVTNQVYVHTLRVLEPASIDRCHP